MSFGPTNKHEARVKSLCAASMAAPLLFHPDRVDWNAKEVCDLVFANRDVVILLTMAEQEVVHSNVEDNLRVADEKIEHNLRQAKGAIRRWKNGRVLVGSNDHGPFEIPYDNAIKVAVLSVIDCHVGIARLHADKAAEWKIDLCATLPHSAMERLVKSRCSVVDIVGICKCLPPETISEKELCKYVDQYIGTCQTKANLRQYWPNELGKDFARIIAILAAMRIYSPSHGSIESPRNGCFQQMADLSLLEMYRLITTMYSAARTAQVTAATVNEILSLSHYSFAISTISHIDRAQLERAGAFADELLAKLQKSEVAYGPHILAIADPFFSRSVQPPYESFFSFCDARIAAGFKILLLTVPVGTPGAALPGYHIAVVSYPPNPPASRLSLLLGKSSPAVPTSNLDSH